MKMVELDQRYVEILAGAIPRPTPKKYLRLSQVGFLVMLVGGFLFLNYAVFSYMGIAVLGVVLIGIALVNQGRFIKKSKKEFINYFNQTGQLPPFPENAKPESVKPEEK